MYQPNAVLRGIGMPQSPAPCSSIVITKDLVSTDDRASALAEALVLLNET